MSKTKKILSLVLAVVLLVNVFAVSSFATVADGAILAVSASSDDTLVAGGQVTVDFSFELPADVDYSTYKLGQFIIPVFYDADILTPVSRAWNSSENYDFLNPTANFNTTSSTVMSRFSSYLSTEEAATYTGACLVQCGTYVSGNTQGATTAIGWSMESQKDVIFSITFDVAEDYDGSSAAEVALLASAHPQGTNYYFKTITDKANYTQGKISVDAMDYSAAATALAAPAAEAKVEHEKTMGQMSNWTDATATTFNAGLVGRISNLDIKFDDNNDECETITDIIVSITYGDKTLTGNAYQLYEQADGSYLFRAVVRGADIADTTEFSYEYIVTLSDGSKLTYKSTENTSFSEIYNTAKANYDAANPAA